MPLQSSQTDNPRSRFHYFCKKCEVYGVGVRCWNCRCYKYREFTTKRCIAGSGMTIDELFGKDEGPYTPENDPVVKFWWSAPLAYSLDRGW